MTMIANVYSGTSIATLPISSSGTGAVALPAHLHVVPGKYLVGGNPYDMVHGQTARWFDPNSGIVEQRVCQNGTAPYTADVDSYIGALSCVHHNGPRDGGISDTTACNKAMHQEIEMLCGDIAQFTKDMLDQYGTFSTRIVALLTDAPNGYDNGHITMEENSQGHWRHWDTTLGCYFTDSSGNHLSLKGISDLGIENCTMVQYCNKRTACNVQNVSGGVLDNGFYNDFVTTTNGVRAWVNRIYKLFALKDAGVYKMLTPSTPALISWAQSQGYTNFLTAAQFAAYYP